MSDFNAADLSQAKPNVKRGIIGACPRCIKGNIYQEANGETTCLQCGYHGSAKTTGKTETLQSKPEGFWGVDNI